MNGLYDLAQYFSTEDRPVEIEEILEFWRSLSPEEEDYYRSVPLDTERG